MTETTETIEIHRGLKGVYFDRSRCPLSTGPPANCAIAAIRSTTSPSIRASRRPHAPAQRRSADARSSSRLRRGAQGGAQAAGAGLDIIRAIKSGASHGRAAHRGVGALRLRSGDRRTIRPEATLRKGMRLTVPGADDRRRARAIWPRPSRAADALGARGESSSTCSRERSRAPMPRQLMDIDMILHAEHGSNASRSPRAWSRAPRPICTRRSPPRWPRSPAGARRRRGERDAHGAGDRRCGQRRRYVKRKRANSEAVMGFGHRVYRAEDPRARHMRAGVEQLSREMGQPHWYQILEAVVEAMKPTRATA